MQLLELQKKFQHNIQTGPESEDLRFRIYQRAFFIRTIESLEDDFERVRGALGPERFEEIAEQFVRQNAMNLSTLWELGHNFAQFLRTHPKTADESRLARLAQIDFAELRVSTTAERIASADLPSLDFEKSSIRRSPHIEILEHGDDHRPRVIFKKQGEVENEILSPTEYLILKGLDPAIPLSQFSERLDRAGFGNPEKVQKTLTHWIRSHWVEIQSGERK